MWGYHHQIGELKGFETGTASKHGSHTETVEGIGLLSTGKGEDKGFKTPRETQDGP